MADAVTTSAPATPTTTSTSAPSTPPAAANAESKAAPKGKEAALNGATGKETPKGKAEPSPEKHKLTVDGQEVEVTLDELKKMYSIGTAGQKRMKEAAEQQKALQAEKAKIESIMQAFQKGDFQALANAGLSLQDVEALSIRYLSALQKQEEERYRINNLGPKEREIYDREQLLREREQKLSAFEQKQKDAAVQHVKERFTNDVIQTLEQFPEQYRRNEALAQLAVDAWAHVYEHNLQVTPQKVAEEVRKEFRNLHRLMIDNAKEEEYGDYISEETLKKILKRSQKAAEEKAHPGVTAKPQVRNGKKADEQPAKRHVGYSEYLRYGPEGRPGADEEPAPVRKLSK